MRVGVEISVEVEDPDTLIAAARRSYRRTVTAVDMDGLSEAEAMAVARMSIKKQRAHPRYITPEQGVPDGPAAVLYFIERALLDVRVELDESATSVLDERPEPPIPLRRPGRADDGSRLLRWTRGVRRR